MNSQILNSFHFSNTRSCCNLTLTSHVAKGNHYFVTNLTPMQSAVARIQVIWITSMDLSVNALSGTPYSLNALSSTPYSLKPHYLKLDDDPTQHFSLEMKEALIGMANRFSIPEELIRILLRNQGF